MTSHYKKHPSSFKDPSGFIFELKGVIYRQVNAYYAVNFDTLMRSGLYKQLTSQKLLITHEEISENITQKPEWYKTLKPAPIPFISYPYEWCFEQLRDAALLTLNILRTAINYGMILKDATPFNIQFIEGRPVFIDTLSFEEYDASQPWIAYRQFCECFLFPLYLEHYLGKDIQKILSNYIDGIPVDMAARLLPWKSKLNPGVWLHVHLQNTIHQRSKKEKNTTSSFTKQKLLNLISHLESIIKHFPQERKNKTTWSAYYNDDILSREYLHEKEEIFRNYCEEMTAQQVLDLGANDGYFSKIPASKGILTVATDIDGQCINRLYRETKEKNIENILPLIVDIANPSPAIGFGNTERSAFFERVQPDLVLALALIHHLVIGKNIPLPTIAAWLNDIAPQLIIEFVPKEDEKVQQMLKNRKDIFSYYTRHDFEDFFSQYFIILRHNEIPGTHRVLYFMQRKNGA